MIYQIQYRIRGRQPTKRLIAEARKAYAENKVLPSGVTVKPLAWLGTTADLRKALRQRKAFIGHAGIVKSYADPRLTLCDYDSDWRLPIHHVVRIAQMVSAWPVWLREDRTARGWHVLIYWNRPFKPIEQVAIQCVLGSDRQREAYNLARVLSGKKSKRWNLLFERKL